MTLPLSNPEARQIWLTPEVADADVEGIEVDTGVVLVEADDVILVEDESEDVILLDRVIDEVDVDDVATRA